MQGTAIEASISKAEFARRRGVSAGRVTQYISEGKIKRPALVGEGRNERIVESIAVSQLRETLDIHQRLGNGAATNLSFESPTVSAGDAQVPIAAAAKPVNPADEIGEAIRREQLESLQRKNRREAIEEEVASGRFVDADQTAAEMGRLAAQLVVSFEGSLPDFADAVAAKFQLPKRDVLHLLRATYREVRAKQAAAVMAEAEAAPALVEAEIETQGEVEPA